ncbi:MAG: efflux RND transporter periplasmic adaptor subunit [Rhizobiaceae bacterium]|nr:efflux RND transporter periplasmic adaptor subunit [Rhizobiaceae bacterium]
MPKIKFHQVAAVVVFVATAAWVATGEFSSVGSAADEAPAEAQEVAPHEAETVLRTVAVVDAPRIMHSRAIRLSGTTEADKKTVLTTRAGGIIAELPVKQGGSVKAGDLILKLEAEGKEAMVETARQLLLQREAEAEAAKRLAESGSLPKLQLDNALSALAAAKSQLESAIAELGRIELRAPFDGVVDVVNVEQGSPVGAGAAVLTLLALDPILAIGEVNERDLKHVKAGDKAAVRLVNGQEVEGEVRYISYAATQTTRTYRAEVAVPNPDLSIPAGMTSEITIRAEPVAATVLPRSVLTLSNDGDIGVRGVNAEDIVVFFPIDIVDDTPNGMVLGGIPEGVRIIVAGQQLISEGDKVVAVQADEEMIEKLISEATGGTL